MQVIRITLAIGSGLVSIVHQYNKKKTMKMVSTKTVNVLTFAIVVITTAIHNSNADGKYANYI